MSECRAEAGGCGNASLEAVMTQELDTLLEAVEPRPPVSRSEVVQFASEAQEGHDPLTVLSRLLDAVRESGRFEAVAMADAAGCIVAGAGAWSVCEELAACAPLLAARGPVVNDTVPTRLDVLARRSEVRRLSVDGIAVFLCGRGGAVTLDGAARECERALQATRAAR